MKEDSCVSVKSDPPQTRRHLIRSVREFLPLNVRGLKWDVGKSPSPAAAAVKCRRWSGKCKDADDLKKVDLVQLAVTHEATGRAAMDGDTQLERIVAEEKRLCSHGHSSDKTHMICDELRLNLNHYTCSWD